MTKTPPTPISAPICPLCNSILTDLSADFNSSFSEYQCPTIAVELNSETTGMPCHYYKIKAAQITTIIIPPFIIASSSNKTIVHLWERPRLNQLATLEPIDPFNSTQINDIITRFKNLIAFL